MSELDPSMFNTETHEIVCTECETSPRLLSLDKNSGTVVGCDCDDARHSLDSVPYEFSINDMVESWVVVEGRTPKQIAKEVDSMLDSGNYGCPSCGDDFGLMQSVSCAECGFIPEENRA